MLYVAYDVIRCKQKSLTKSHVILFKTYVKIFPLPLNLDPVKSISQKRLNVLCHLLVWAVEIVLSQINL